MSRLKERHRLAVRAALLDGEAGAQAYASWRRLVPLDEADHDEFRILPLIYLRAQERGRNSPDMGRLKGVYRQVWVRNTLLLQTCAGAVRLLSKAAIPTILLKGTAMFARWSAELGPRSTRDIDVLVPRADARRASRILNDAGWRRTGLAIVEQSTEADLDWWPGVSLTNADGVEFDLHWRPLPPNTAREHAAMFWRDSQPHEVMGETTRILRPEDQLYHALLHGARWTDGAGLDWIVDMASLLRAYPDGLDWERVLMQARRDRSIPAIADRIRQFEVVLGIKTPITDALQQHRCSRLDRYVFRRYREPYFNPRRGEITLVNLHAHLAGRQSLSLLRALIGFVCRQWSLERPAELLAEAVFRCLGRPHAVRRWLSRSGIGAADKATSLPAIGASSLLSDPEGSPFLSGWSGPEPGGRWTGDVDNVLAFADETGQHEDLLVTLRAIPYLAPRHRRLRVDAFANGRRCAVWRFEGAPQASRALAFTVPRATRRLRPNTLLLVLSVRNPGRPVRTGASRDSRRLGLLLESMSFGYPDVADPFAAPFNFSSGGNDGVLICGWSYAEPQGRWTDGRRASLALQWIGDDHELDVRLEGLMFEGLAEPNRSLEVSADGTPSPARITFDSELRVTASLRVRPVRIDRRCRLRLDLSISRPRSPLSCGLSDDIRALGFLLERLELQRLC